MRYYVVLIDEKIRQTEEVTEEPATILVKPLFSAQYCDENDNWQVPCHVFKRYKMKKSKTRAIYYYLKQDESNPRV